MSEKIRQFEWKEQTENEIQRLYHKIMDERLTDNAFARDVFAETAPHPHRMRCAEDLYRTRVLIVREQAMGSEWPRPTEEEMEAGALPCFRETCFEGKVLMNPCWKGCRGEEKEKEAR